MLMNAFIRLVMSMLFALILMEILLVSVNEIILETVSFVNQSTKKVRESTEY